MLALDMVVAPHRVVAELFAELGHAHEVGWIDERHGVHHPFEASGERDAELHPWAAFNAVAMVEASSMPPMITSSRPMARYSASLSRTSAGVPQAAWRRTTSSLTSRSTSAVLGCVGGGK